MKGVSYTTRSRQSNIELLRIVAMLVIIAHHYVVNSTVGRLFDPANPTANMVFLQIWGMWGKTAINVFVLITGYFMCTSRLTVRRYMKILLEIIFYSWVMYFVLAAVGYETITLKGVVKRLILDGITRRQNGGFVPAFMWMYLLIPAMNVYISSATRKNMLWTVGVLLAMFTICGTFLSADVYHHVFWYVTLYLCGAAIRLIPFGWMNRNEMCVPLLIGSVLSAWASVIAFDFLAASFGRWVWSSYAFVVDSHKLLAFTTALFSFLVFKNLRIPYSRFINTVAATTFGVLLIHAATDGMRKWLWQDFVDVPAAYGFSLPALVGYSILVMFAVFAVCSALDYLRVRFLERPMLDVVDALISRLRRGK